MIGRYADVSRQVTYYERLAGLASFFHRWRMLPFDNAAAQEFKRLRHERIRIGTADLKIAAIALTHQGPLLSSNLRDFDQVPGLRGCTGERVQQGHSGHYQRARGRVYEFQFLRRAAVSWPRTWGRKN